MIQTVLGALNGGFLQTLKLFAVTLAGALPLGLLLSFCSLSRFMPLKWLTRTLVWFVRGTPRKEVAIFSKACYNNSTRNY